MDTLSLALLASQAAAKCAIDQHGMFLTDKRCQDDVQRDIDSESMTCSSSTDL
jgi:hypothetical protein